MGQLMGGVAIRAMFADGVVRRAYRQSRTATPARIYCRPCSRWALQYVTVSAHRGRSGQVGANCTEFSVLIPQHFLCLVRFRQAKTREEYT